MFKLPKKKSSVARKVTPKKSVEEEQPAFGFKLKKASTVKRNWQDDKMETVELKHHEFEKLPQEEDVELTTTVVLSEPIEAIDKEKEEKEKKKKKKKKVCVSSSSRFRASH